MEGESVRSAVALVHLRPEPTWDCSDNEQSMALIESKGLGSIIQKNLLFLGSRFPPSAALQPLVGIFNSALVERHLLAGAGEPLLLTVQYRRRKESGVLSIVGGMGPSE